MCCSSTRKLMQIPTLDLQFSYSFSWRRPWIPQVYVPVEPGFVLKSTIYMDVDFNTCMSRYFYTISPRDILMWCGHWPAVSVALWLRRGKVTWTTEILWRKRDDMAVLSVREGWPCPLPGQALIAFLGTLHWGWSSLKFRFRWLPFTENKRKDVANYIKKGYLQM